MSNYPSPYPPPSPYAGPPPVGYGPAPSSPARRAGLMMFILGPTCVLLGGCVGGVTLLLSSAGPTSPDLDRLRTQVFPPGISPRVMLAGFGVIAAILFGLGATLLALAAFVRRGSRGPTAAATAVTGLVLLYMLVNTVAILLRAGDPNAAGGLCVCVGVTAAFALQFAWLIAALRARPAAGAGAGAGIDPYQQYLAQYYQYQQNAQAYAAEYGQGGGYGYAPAPPAPHTDPAAVPPPNPPLPPPAPGST